MSNDAPLPDLPLLSSHDPARLYLALLPGVQLYWCGRTQPPPGPKLLALLAYVHLRGRVSREELAEVFWPGKDRKGGLQSVRQALTQLRKQPGAEGWLSEEEQGLALGAASDVSEFRRLLETGDVAGALAFAGTGELLAGLPAPSEVFGNWLEEERRSLNELRVQVLRRYGAELTEAKAFEKARQCLLQAQQLEADNEATYRTLMELEYRAGDPARALEVFEQCRQMLHTELGVAPSTETLALLAEIEGQQAANNQRGQLLTRPADLPQANEPLYGREAVRRKLLDLLGPGARVLLHGLGGLGKTRLASALAASFLQRGGQVIWLEMGSDSAGAVLAALQELVKVRSVEALAGALAGQKVGLVVLDNVANTYAAQQVLASLPADVPVLVTARLRLPGIRALELTRLERESALQVLQHHLRGETDVAPNTEHDAPNLDALCALLGDHPFALRLAALTLAHGGSGVMQALYAAPHDTIRTLLEQSLVGVSPREYEVFLALGSLYAPQATPELLSVLLGRPLPAVEEALWQLTSRGLLSRESRAGSDTLCFRITT